MPTILDYRSIAPFKLKEFSTTPIWKITKHIDKLIDSNEDPQLSAVKFYTLNHLVAILGQSVPHDVELQQYNKLYKDYVAELTHIGVRLFYYILCICVRESRHLLALKDEYLSHKASKLLRDLQGSGSQSIGKFINLTKLGEDNCNVTIGELVDLLMPIFNNHNWNASFGGSAWGLITEQIKKYIEGEYSLELLTDTAFTLAHNNGNIFNKGLIYSSHTSSLGEVLDVQRSGQLPEYVKSNTWIPPNIRYTLTTHINSVVPFQKFKDIVDWQKVMDLGAINNYSHYLPKTKDSNPVDEVKTEVPNKKLKSKTNSNPDKVTIYPGLTLTKTIRTGKGVN